MVEKTQKLVEHIKNHKLGLSLTANIHENSATIKMYDNYGNNKLTTATHHHIKSVGPRKSTLEIMDRSKWNFT